MDENGCSCLYYTPEKIYSVSLEWTWCWRGSYHCARCTPGLWVGKCPSK